MKRSDIEHIITSFHAKTLPKEKWTHQAHLITGLHAIQTNGLSASIPLMREAIKSYNIAVGGENTDTGGYHESITIFFLYALEAFASQHKNTTSLPDLVVLLLESKMMERPFILQFYRKETIFSVNARRSWVEPDKQPLHMLSQQTI